MQAYKNDTKLKEMFVDEIINHRFFSKVEKTDNCWNWKGAKTSGNYGVFWLDKKNTLAHRTIFEIFTGKKIPKNLTIDHICNNSLCVNPEHMEIVSLGVNVLRGNNPLAKNARKTLCKNGHAFDKNNTYIRPTGGRACKECKREWNRQND